MITALGLLWLQFVPCLQMDRLTHAGQQRTTYLSTAELKALSCAKNYATLVLQHSNNRVYPNKPTNLLHVYTNSW